MCGNQRATDLQRDPLYARPVHASLAFDRPRRCHRTDIYAVGIMLYQLVTGEVPFTGKSFMMVLTKQTTEMAQAPSERAPQLRISAELDAVILKALAKDPGERWATMRELAEAIAALPHDAATQVPASAKESFALPTPLRRERIAIVSLTVLVLLLSAALLAVLSSR